VKNPLQPTYAGCFGTDGYTHDAQCVIYNGPDTNYRGREVCFAFNENSVTIVDVHVKTNMVVIAKSAYVNVAYCHQGWITEDHTLLLVDDELDENKKPSAQQFTKTYAWNIRNLRTPTLQVVHEHAVRSIDHNQYIVGDYTYQANYESGLRVLRINKSTYQLTQVAYFDVYPSRTTSEFNGAWSTYPFFKSGTILISSIDYGLFVVKVDWSKINMLEAEDYAEQTRTRPIIATGQGSVCPALTEIRTCAAQSFC